MNNKTNMTAMILSAVMSAATEAARAAQDKKITVNEIIDLVKSVVNSMGFGDMAVVDLEKK